MGETTVGRVMCTDCRHVWAARWTDEEPAPCPRCGSLASIGSSLPWRLISPASLRYLRNRLAGHSCGEIAEWHGQSVQAVKMTLHRAVVTINRRTPLRVRNPADLLLVAAYDHLPAEKLPAVTFVTHSEEAVAENEMAGVGCA